MTRNARLHRMTSMKKIFVTGVVLAMLALAGTALGQKDKEEEPTAWLYFVVVKDDNGKPVRNAAVIMHPVNPKGKQSRGGMELRPTRMERRTLMAPHLACCGCRCWHRDFRRSVRTTTSRSPRWRSRSS